MHMHEEVDEVGEKEENHGAKFIEVIDEISEGDIDGEQILCIL